MAGCWSFVWMLLVTLKVGYIWLAVLYWLFALCRVSNWAVYGGGARNLWSEQPLAPPVEDVKLGRPPNVIPCGSAGLKRKSRSTSNQLIYDNKSQKNWSGMNAAIDLLWQDDDASFLSWSSNLSLLSIDRSLTSFGVKRPTHPDFFLRSSRIRVNLLSYESKPADIREQNN